MNYNDQYAYYRHAVEETLRDAVPADVPNPLGDAMRYSLLAGGKRLRPVLLLAAYAILQRDLTPALPFAAAAHPLLRWVQPACWAAASPTAMTPS